ncbi:MAG: type sorting protein [Hymenobacter sp.]|nr:type sorting protein [Hymenobacter sp.]
MRSFYKLFARPQALLLAACILFLTGTAGAQAPAWQWGLQTTNPAPSDLSTARGNAVATDAAGRVYVGGSYLSRNAVDNASRSFGSAGTLAAGRGGFVAQASAAGQWSWVVEVAPTGPGPGNPGFVSVTGITVTPTGDIYATGLAEGASVRVGTQSRALGPSGLGMFVARLNSAGVCQALQVAEGNFYLIQVAPDPSTGGVVVAGSYQGPASFGSTTLAAGTAAVVVARLTAAGQWLSATAASGRARYIASLNVAVGAAGQVGITGSFGQGDMSFGNTTLYTSPNASDALMIAQLSPANQWQWALGGQGSTSSGTFGAAYTASGALWVNGWGTNGTVVGATTLLAPGGSATQPSYAGFAGQVSATGQWSMVRQVAGSSGSLVGFFSLRLDGAGNAVMLGSLRTYSGAAQASLGGQSLTSPAGGILLFVAGLDAAGQWHYVAAVPQAAVPYGLFPTDMALDGAGNLYLTGELQGGLTLGTTPLLGNDYGDVMLGKLANATTLASRAASPATALACYPNPARTAATLRLPAAAATATLTDALGRPVRTYRVPAHAATATLDLTGLAPGLYGVRCGTASGRLVVE